MLQNLLNSSDSSLTIIIAVAVVLITAVIIWFLKRSPTSQRYFLLLGNSNAGKTALYSRLVFKKTLPTHTSTKENKGTFNLDIKNKKVEVIDVPGYGNIRNKFIEQYKKLTKGIIFVIDSETFNKESKDIAVFLYDILSDSAFSKLRIPILIACNKQDIDLAKSQSLIKSSLEKEIETLRKTTASALDSTSGTDNQKQNLLTKLDKQFEFNDLRKVFKIDFCECNVIDGEKAANISPVLQWLEVYS